MILKVATRYGSDFIKKIIIISLKLIKHEDKNLLVSGADPENLSRGWGPTLSKKKPITHTETPDY